MPIQTIPEKARTMLHFGTGDIHITDAKMAVEDGSHHLVVFHQMEPHPIGSSAPELHGTACDDFSVGMTFTRPESIDAVVNVLTEFKAKHFPAALQTAAKQPEGADCAEALHWIKDFMEECETAEDRSNLDGDSADAVLEQINDGATEALKRLTIIESALRPIIGIQKD